MTSRAYALIFLALLSLAVLLLAAAGEVLSWPALQRVGPPPVDLPTQAVLLHTPKSQAVAGWLVRGQPGAGAVLLLHGVRADRRSMIGRAEFLHRLGYSVLLIDLPAHGESTAKYITYGANEAEGVRAALDYLAHEMPAERVGVIGVSLGAASLVLGRPEPAPSAVVLESMFPTIAEAVEDRLRSHLGGFAVPFAPLLLCQLPLRLGVSPEQLRPIDALPALHAPVLIMAGSADQSTTLPETERLFAAAHEPKQLWVLDGAAHVDLHEFAPQAYETRVSDFLARYLRPGLEAQSPKNAVN